MVDFTSTQAQAKEVAPPAKPLSASPLLTTSGVDKMYHQMAEIHAITTIQLVECAHWRRSDSTPSLVWVGIGQQRSTAMPSKARLAPSPPTNFSS
jgi:hypothetical protein